MIIVLPGKAMPVTNEKSVKIFGGGADCYLPDFIGRDGSALNIFSLIIGAAALCSASVLHIPQLFCTQKEWIVFWLILWLCQVWGALWTAVIVFIAVKLYRKIKAQPTRDSAI